MAKRRRNMADEWEGPQPKRRARQNIQDEAAKRTNKKRRRSPSVTPVSSNENELYNMLPDFLRLIDEQDGPRRNRRRVATRRRAADGSEQRIVRGRLRNRVREEPLPREQDKQRRVQRQRQPRARPGALSVATQAIVAVPPRRRQRGRSSLSPLSTLRTIPIGPPRQRRRRSPTKSLTVQRQQRRRRAATQRRARVLAMSQRRQRRRQPRARLLRRTIDISTSSSEAIPSDPSVDPSPSPSLHSGRSTELRRQVEESPSTSPAQQGQQNKEPFTNSIRKADSKRQIGEISSGCSHPAPQNEEASTSERQNGDGSSVKAAEPVKTCNSTSHKESKISEAPDSGSPKNIRTMEIRRNRDQLLQEIALVLPKTLAEMIDEYTRVGRWIHPIASSIFSIPREQYVRTIENILNTDIDTSFNIVNGVNDLLISIVQDPRPEHPIFAEVRAMLEMIMFYVAGKARQLQRTTDPNSEGEDR